MDETTLEILEFPAVLGELAGFTMTPPGRSSVLALRPLADRAAIDAAFAGFLEVREIVRSGVRLPLGGTSDITPLFNRLEPAGAYLLPEDLMLVKGNLQAGKALRAMRTAVFARQNPRTAALIDAVSEQGGLYSSLDRILDEKGEIKDGASSELLRIRRTIRSSRDRARSILEGLVSDRHVAGEFLQEDFITIREDRYVLCVKAGMQTTFNGVIHGRSGSGAAYFMEPMQLVELNNRVAVLKKEEKAEEIAILKEASREVMEQRAPLSEDLSIIGSLDSFQARALFADETAAVAPIVRKGGRVRLKCARHPLLISKEKKGGPGVVPIDIIMPEGCSVLVISGANTGGKTVALKTLGLLTVMALSGIPVPAEEGSEAALFTSIFADIGDRQDIIASLSTFSAHIKRMCEFLEETTAGSLVLIDEIGAGTDPSEGGAFALAALQTLRERGASVVITTHLNMLKAHAQADPAYMNASVEFDETTLRPLYQLRYGVPGPSLGLSIARSLGIPAQVIERARRNLDEKEGAFIESIRLLEKDRDEMASLKKRLAELEAKRGEAVERLRTERAAILARARGKAEGVVKEAKDELRGVIERLKEAKPTIGPGKAAIEMERSRARALERLGARPSDYRPQVGQRAAIIGTGTKGEVVSVDADGKRAELAVGGIKVWAPWGKLRKIGAGAPGPPVKAGSSGADVDMEASATINIIGMRADEAIPLVTRFIDNAFAAGLPSVEIIHGVGTGRLSAAVAGYLGKNPQVKGFHHGEASHGGAGVTVVELA
ncbi:MAG: endonuclease MutS2 [Thermodesulfobacteriota bacterium]